MSGADYLFSVDLEDVRQMVPDGGRFRPRVSRNTDSYLDFLARNNARCTFFTVGSVMRGHPELMHRIVDLGHEVACHTDSHLQLEKLGPDAFRRDLDTWLSVVTQLQLPRPLGFRAPTFSLTERTAWAYPILREYGFTYSSSVLPARNPLYGWPEFGQQPRLMDGILEIPMNLAAVGPWRVPFGGGVYFRVLPWFVLRPFFLMQKRSGNPVLGYFHPYDVDTEQERFMHPDLNDNRLLNALMYLGRGRTIPRLNRVMEMGFRIGRYDDFVRCRLDHAH